MDSLIIILVFLAAGAVYFIPTIAGWYKRNVTAIFVLNLLLGWTLIGWVVALAWACTEDSETQVVIKQVSQPKDHETVRLENLKKLKDLLDSGAITEIEYRNEKAKLLGDQVIPPGSTVQL